MELFAPVWLSIKLATVTTVILLLIGTPIAWWLAHSRSKMASVAEAIVALPLVLPPTVLGFYLLIALGENGFLGGMWSVTLTDTVQAVLMIVGLLMLGGHVLSDISRLGGMQMDPGHTLRRKEIFRQPRSIAFIQIMKTICG